MARFIFSGVLDSVRERHLEYISEVLEKNGFNGPNATIENVGAAGDNYLANVKRVVVTENGKTFKMIAKLAPEHEIMRSMAQIDMLFRNEHVIYTELLPKFSSIQKRAGVPNDEMFRYALCYGSLSEVPNEIILLEDLKESQFSIPDRFKALNNDTVKLVLKNFAIFHSLSYVLKHQEPETYAEIKSKFGDMFANPAGNPEHAVQYFHQLESVTIAALTDDKYKNIVKGSICDLHNLHKEMTEADFGGKHSVIQQGDGWTNNIMFKCQNDIPTECILIDYQMTKENNPCFDIMYFLFSSTDHKQRLEHYHEFIDYYHEELDKSLHYYGLEAAQMYPRDQLDCDLKRYGKLMFATCILVANVILKTSDDAVNMKEAINTATEENVQETMASVIKTSPDNVILFRSKIEGLVDSFIEFGLL